MVGCRMVRIHVRNRRRGVYRCNRFLVAAVPVDGLRGGVRLAGDGGVVGAVGLVDRHADRGGVPVLDELVVGLVPQTRPCYNQQDNYLNYTLWKKYSNFKNAHGKLQVSQLQM